MHTVSFAEACDKLAGLMDEVTRDRHPISITRNGEANVVLMAAEDYSAIQETLHLLSTPANAERIRQGLADYAAGRVQAGELCD